MRRVQFDSRWADLGWNFLLALAVFGGFVADIEWLKWTAAGFIWLMLLCYLASLAVLSDEPSKGTHIRSKKKLPWFFTVPFDVTVTGVLFMGGWIGTAGAYAISSIFVLVTHHLLRAGPSSPPTSETRP